MLLIIQAYDAARKAGINYIIRLVSVPNFIKALFLPLKFDNILQSKPISWPLKHKNDIKKNI